MDPDNEICTTYSNGWVLCKSKSNPGRKYYFNRKTGRSFWSKSEALEKPCSSKKSTKMEKKRIQEKNKKEEIRKRALKRKSDGNNDEPFKERCSKECHHKDTQKKIAHDKVILHREINSKRDTSNNNKSYITTSTDTSQLSKSASTKNLANKRLSVLRSNLSTEVTEENSKNNESKKVKSSPKYNQNDTPVKAQRTDLKSPNVNESKCTITSQSQSPNSDSFQSTPSPSQFFAANKIISSMKAQLPEEYNIKEKQKDTFADIEQGICNQMPEYPFNKHPATPPQFSEANKLVSAIKSKLTYKMSVPQEASVTKFANAKERMEVLRRSLTETTDKTELVNTTHSLDLMEPTENIDKSPEAMDVEEVKEIEPSRPQAESEMNNVSIIQTNFVLVVDTNIFIHELSFIKNVVNSHIKGYSEKPTLLIPWRVINELDNLKDKKTINEATCKIARAAMDFLYKSLPENDRIKGQSLRDANNHIYPCEGPDDEILNCCLQQVQRGKSVLLLTNDRNLCNKATINNVQRISLEDLRYLMVSHPEPVVNTDISARMKYYEDTMFPLLANILESEMQAKYGTLWRHVVHRAPPWQLSDVVASLLKHWRNVFSDVMPRLQQQLADLGTALAHAHKKKRTLSESDLSCLKVLCGEIARKCQIIPEYMELAKAAVQRLNRYDSSCEVTDALCDVTDAPDPQLPVNRLVGAFESIWTLFSSYCAKLCTCLGVPHGLEDNLPGNETGDALSNKWAIFRGHVETLAHAIKGALSTESSDMLMEDQISRLESALKDCLGLMSLDGGVVGRDELRIFCSRNGDMLQEAYIKLSQLADLLDICKSNMHI